MSLVDKYVVLFLPKCMYGYRKPIGTTEGTVNLKETIITNIEDKKKVAPINCDTNGAFDNVSLL